MNTHESAAHTREGACLSSRESAALEQELQAFLEGGDCVTDDANDSDVELVEGDDEEVGTAATAEADSAMDYGDLEPEGDFDFDDEV